ncbi:MAG TPA: nucleotide exchange factor GrpE [Polyangia bacterium]|jgi:molecular chaperone GrpE|nr:nucleotide exchange factor GrpE [Polyangia bacterium]
MTDNTSSTGGANGADDKTEDGVDNGAPAANTPEEKIAALTAERDEMKDRMLRVAAEFENWKKRARKDQTDGEARVREGVLKDLLDVADNLDRAVTAQGSGDGKVDAAALFKGVNLVLRLFQQKLERYDVKPFEAKGQPFDPKVHEAISKVASADVPAGSVASEFQKGYRIGERLLRPAMVAVSTGPAGGAAEEKGQA